MYPFKFADMKHKLWTTTVFKFRNLLQCVKTALYIHTDFRNKSYSVRFQVLELASMKMYLRVKSFKSMCCCIVCLTFNDMRCLADTYPVQNVSRVQRHIPLSRVALLWIKTGKWINSKCNSIRLLNLHFVYFQHKHHLIWIMYYMHWNWVVCILLWFIMVFMVLYRRTHNIHWYNNKFSLIIP
jgi:hypothetical protein